MNDNIERLCEELLHYDNMIFGWRETVERAAEAIVKECCEAADGPVYFNKVTGAWSWPVTRIKEHFGVKP